VKTGEEQYKILSNLDMRECISNVQKISQENLMASKRKTKIVLATNITQFINLVLQYCNFIFSS
jgi:hypothetical protein